MKIAINCAFFQPRGGGIKEYIHNLVENISVLDSKNEYILYVLQDSLDYAKDHLNTQFRIKTIPYKGNGLINKINRSLFEKNYWVKEEKVENWDIFHSPFFHSHTPKHAKLILTVHDMRFFRYPKTYTFLRYQFLKRAVKRSIKNAHQIIAISQFTKDEICEAYQTSPTKISVIHEAINPSHFSITELNKLDNILISEIKDTPYILTVGHLEPRKNYDRLISAFQKIKNDLDVKTKLVIIGKKSHDYESTLNEIRKDNDILFLDFVSQDLLNWLYHHASLFVFPSIYEGFGFPPLEAGIHSTISAVSNISSMPEVCGDAVLYFNPFNVDNMAEVIKRGLTDKKLQENLKEKIEIQISKFSWKENAKQTIDMYNSLYSSK